MNTHTLPDVMHETMARDADLLATAILATTLTTPGSGLTLPAFSTQGYVRNGSPTRLVYVNQPAAAVTIAGGAGAYWLALMHDTHSAVSGWTRQAGTHYAWQANATQPADPAGGLVMAGVTVTGANISAVNSAVNFPYQKVAFGGSAGQLAFDKNLTWNGSTLNVVGNVDARHVGVVDHPGDNETAYSSTLNTAGGTNRWQVYAAGTAPSYLGGALTVNGTTTLSSTLQVGGATTLNSTLQVNGATTIATTLNVTGTTTLGLVGFGVVPVSGYSITTGGASQFASSVTVGMVGTAAGATLDVNGTVRSRGALTVDTDLTVNGVTNLGSTAGHKLNVGGNIYVTNGIGVGSAPQGGWSLTSGGGILAGGAIQGSSSLYITTTGTFLGNVAVASTNTTTYQLLVAGTAGKTGGGSWSDVSSRDFKRNIADIPDALALLLAQRGRRYEWDEPEHARLLPGLQHGFVYDEVTIPQWREVGPGGEDILSIRGFEALAVEALRTVVARLDALELAR